MLAEYEKGKEKGSRKNGEESTQCDKP